MLKRLFFKLFKPQLIKAIDFGASYKSQWTNGGVPTATYEKSFDKDYLSKLINDGYLTIKDESIGVDDLKRKVYCLTPKAIKLAVKPKEKDSDMYKQLFWWLMGIVGAVIATLITTHAFGVGK